MLAVQVIDFLCYRTKFPHTHIVHADLSTIMSFQWVEWVVSNQWTGLLDWTTGLTFDHKNSFTEWSVGHEIDTTMSTGARRKSKDCIYAVRRL